jgi:hypothetical protein
MIEECKLEPPNKRLLATESLDVLSDLKLSHIASKMRIFAAIEASPERSDIALILAVPLADLPDGIARIRAIDAARKVADAFQSESKMQALARWQEIASPVREVQDAQKRLLESLARAKATKKHP